jgi:enoyl-CoA hydratase/carnithine racemase
MQFVISFNETALVCCDVVFAVPHTKFGFPFSKLGIVPEMGSTQVLQAGTSSV